MQQLAFSTTFLGSEIQCFYIKNTEAASKHLSRFMERDVLFGVDTETEALPEYKHIAKAALSPLMSKIRLLQVYDNERAVVFDLKYIPAEIFIPFLEAKRFVAHNALFDLMFFKRMGVRTMNIACTYILFKLLLQAQKPYDEGVKATLGALAYGLLKMPLVKEMGATDWSEPELTFEQVEYSALDAITVLRLAEKMAPAIQQLGLERYWNLMKKVQHPIADMQLNGILLDEEKHRNMAMQWRSSLYAAKKELIQITGLDKITAHTIADYLQRNLSADVLEIWPRTEEGKLKTDAPTLYDYSDLSPIVKPFSEFQKKEKLATSFGTSLINHLNPATGRLHAGYRLCGARTGRLSCSSPNLQQSPRDKEFRENFIAAPGHSFVLADYSSVEVRIAAEVSGDTRMLDLYSRGIDLYKYTAAQLNGKKIEDITKEERTASKALVLGLQFGLSHKKFGQYARKNYKIEINDEEASQRVQMYRKLYPEFRQWQIEEVKQAAENKFTSRTPFGKLRKYDPEAAYGNVLNHKIQGGAAEAMLCAMVHVHNNLPKGCNLVASVHDELIIECPDKDTGEVKHILEECMKAGYLNVFPSGLTTRNLVEAHVGKNWATAKE